jgi:hypothetical protein
MTEQQHSNPIDDLFRKKFEQLPDTPSDAGWDTPSIRVWEHVQANIAQPGKRWAVSSVVLLAAFLLITAFGLYRLFVGSNGIVPEQPTNAPVEQPLITPPSDNAGSNDSASPSEQQSPNRPPKEVKGKTRNTTDGQKPKPSENAADPLPGSKNTLPPNSTEAGKKKSSEN